MRKWFSFIILHVAILFPNIFYWRNYSFSILYFLLLCCKLIVEVWVYLWALSSLSYLFVSISLPIYSFVLLFEIMECVGNSSSFGKIVFVVGETVERLFQNQKMRGEEEGI